MSERGHRSAPAGNDTFKFTTYDQSNTGGSPYSGNILAQSTLTYTVSAAGSNQINATLGGIVVSVGVTPVAFDSITSVQVTATPASGSGAAAVNAFFSLLMVHRSVNVLDAATGMVNSYWEGVPVSSVSIAAPAAAGINSPVNACTDQERNIYVVNGNGNGDIAEFGFDALTANADYTTDENLPVACAIDVDDSLWVINGGDSKIVHYPHNSTTPDQHWALAGGVSEVPSALATDRSGRQAAADSLSCR